MRGGGEKPCASTIIACRVFSEYFSAKLWCLCSTKTYSMPGTAKKKYLMRQILLQIVVKRNRFDVYGIGQSGLKSL
jgi:hypothetical protein